jgi:hypothetical protein
MKKIYLIFIFLFSLSNINKSMQANDLELDELNLDELEHITSADMKTINDDTKTIQPETSLSDTLSGGCMLAKGWLDVQCETYPKSVLTGALFGLYLNNNSPTFWKAISLLITLYPLYKSGNTLYEQWTEKE